MKHTTPPLVSSRVADFQSVMDLGTITKKHHLIIGHGVLMVISWMVFAGVGIITASFYKPVWPEGVTLLRQKPWFTMHGTCMVAAVLCCNIGIIVIYVHVDGFSQIDESNFSKSHPVIGVIVMVLAVINPVLPFLYRCQPGTQRFIYTWAHRGVGMAAYVFAIVNIFSALTLVSAGMPGYTKVIVWLYIVWIIVIAVTLYAHELILERKRHPGPAVGTVIITDNLDYGYDTEDDTSESYELKQHGRIDPLTAAKPGRQTFKLVALALHVIISVALALTTCIIIGVGDRDDD